MIDTETKDLCMYATQISNCSAIQRHLTANSIESYQFNPLDLETPYEDLDALYHLAWKCPPIPILGRVIVEIGSWVGATALVMASARAERIFCIDPFTGNPGDRTSALAKKHGPAKILKTFCANTKPLLFRIIFPLIGMSAGYAAVWPYQVSMVFIDGDHDKIAEDFNLWWQHVTPGGILCGHDYSSHQVVMEFVNALPEEMGVNHHGRTMWSVRKPDALHHSKAD